MYKLQLLVSYLKEIPGLKCDFYYCFTFRQFFNKLDIKGIAQVLVSDVCKQEG